MLARALLLDALQDYWRAGRFPKNPGFPWQVPVFVDAEGTRCAIAHLMELGGAGELVGEIAAARNFAFVRELAHDPRVAAWLAAAGLTVDEAAEIQPAYCQSTWSECVCGDGLVHRFPSAGADGVLEAVTVWKSGVEGIQVTATYGDTGSATVGAVYKVKEGNVFGPGATVLVPLKRAFDGDFWGGWSSFDDAGFSAIEVSKESILQVDASGRPVRCAHDQEATLPVTRAQVVTALQAKDCRAEMAKVNSNWSAMPPCGDSGGGCSSVESPTGDAAVAILLAVAGAVVARRKLARR